MKTLCDYVKNNGKFDDYIGEHKLVLEIDADYMHMSVDDEHKYKISIKDKFYTQDYVQDTLYEEHKTEVRFCEECGKPYDCGFIAGDGDWYCCEDCFEEVMDRDYGKGKWRGTDEEGCYGGFYESLHDDGEWEDTGIFYTEWN